MHTYVIEEKYEDHVHCAVTLDSGATFGQNVYGEARKTLAGIDATIAEAVARVEVAVTKPELAEVALEVTQAIETKARRDVPQEATPIETEVITK